MNEINILLLGETGVGKSTFINGFANYLTYETLEVAMNEEVISLIPSSFTVTNEDFEEKLIQLGTDENECVSPGQAATQTCKCFVFPFGDRLIRLIDTPGVGDPRGLSQDRLNFQDILSFIGQYPQLNCICILLKPNSSRITATFEFCIKELLSHLQKSASNNIVFLFTNARGTFYRPGDTAPSLKQILNDIKKSPPYVNIPFEKKTAYCLDNESFRFLVAIKKGIVFGEDHIEDFSKSWTTSVNECGRLMEYILGSNDGTVPALIPHITKDTISVNEARRLILNLSQPLADISQNIEDNLNVIDRHKEEINANSSNIEGLKDKLYVPCIDIEYKDYDQPRTVCAATNCCEIYEVAGLTKHHYVKRCHDPCYLTNVPKAVLGDPSLQFCAAFETSDNCINCGCLYTSHLHVYYETKVIEKKKKDQNVDNNITSREDIIRGVEDTIEELENEKQKLEAEMETITKATAKFAHFLKTNAIAPYNDSFKAYVEHLIANEESLSKSGVNNQQIISRLQKMLQSYEQEKRILDNAMAGSHSGSAVTAEDVFDAIKDLYKLELYGVKIKESQTKEKARKSELISKQREVIYTPKASTSSRIKSLATKLLNRLKL